MSGFIIMQRDTVEHPLLRDGDRFRAWCWLLCKAAWKPTPFDVNGRVITLQRGQICVSIRSLAEAWGMSKSAADRFLDRLKTETMIETEAGHGRLLITICNYSKYQDAGRVKRDGGGTPSGTAAGQQRDIKEQGNHGTIEEEANASPSSGEREKDLLGEVPVKPKRAAAKKCTRTVGEDHPLPDDWEPRLGPQAQKFVDGWPPGMLDREDLAFRSHAKANGRLAKDWNAAFGTWIAKAEQRRVENEGRAGNRSGGGRDFGQRDSRDGLDRLLDQRLADHHQAGQSEAGRNGEGGQLTIGRSSHL